MSGERQDQRNGLRRFKRYPAYKECGVEWFGKIPAHWEEKPLKALLCRNESGVWGGDGGLDDVIVLRSTDQTIDGNWRIENSERRRLTPLEAVQARLEINDLVVTKSSGSDLHIGKTTLVDLTVAGMKCCFSNFMQRLRLTSGNVPRFYWYCLNSRIAREQFVLLSSTTTGLGNLNGAILGAIRVPFLATAEQQAIVTFLDRETARIDALIAKKERLIELLEEKRAAAITHAVTNGLDRTVAMKSSGVDWLGPIPAHWEVKPFTKYVVDKSDYRGKTPEKVLSGVFLVTARNVKMGFIDYQCSEEFVPHDQYEQIMTRGLPKKDDILFTTEAPLGNVALVDREDIALAQRIIRFRMDVRHFHPRFTMLSMTSDYFQAQLATLSTGSTAEGLKASKLPMLRLLAPPLPEQAAIGRFLDTNDARMAALMRRVDEGISSLKELRAGIVAATVTGQIDVRKQPA